MSDPPTEPREEDLKPVLHPSAGDDYNPSRDRESVRGQLALGLLALLALLSFGLVFALVSGWRTWDEIEGLATLTFTPLVSLTGTMLGFYFGQKA